MGQLRDLRSRTAHFGFRADEHDREIRGESPTRKFAFHCAECNEQAVRLRIGCVEGEVVVTVECRRCSTKEQFPPALVDCLTGSGD